MQVNFESYVRGGFPVKVEVGFSSSGEVDYIDLRTMKFKSADWLKMTKDDVERIEDKAREIRSEIAAEEREEAREFCKRRGFMFLGG